MFLMVFFSSINEVNRLVSKGMLKIHLNVAIEKNWRSQNFDFLSLKNLSPGQFLESCYSRRCHWILKLPVGTVVFYYFNFGRNYNVLKPKSPCILLNKNINFNKNETESKMKNLTHIFKETNLLLQLILEFQIKSKTVMSWSSRKKKEGIFCTVNFVRKEFF